MKIISLNKIIGGEKMHFSVILEDEEFQVFEELTRIKPEMTKEEALGVAQKPDTGIRLMSKPFDIELYISGLELSLLAFEDGKTDFKDYSEQMIVDLGERIKPYLKSFYEGARYLPGTVAKNLTALEKVAQFDIDKFNHKEDLSNHQSINELEIKQRATPDVNETYPYFNQFHKESTTRKKKKLEEQKNLKLNLKEEVKKMFEMHERITIKYPNL